MHSNNVAYLTFIWNVADVITYQGTASAGDFTPITLPQTVTFEPDVKELSIEIDITQDNELEDDEYFVIVLDNAVAGNVGSRSLCNVVIEDDDCKINISYL